MKIKNIGFKEKNLLILLAISIFSINFLLVSFPAIRTIFAQETDFTIASSIQDLYFVQNNSLAPVSSPSLASLYPSLGYKASEFPACPRMEVIVTGYSSVPSQTDSTPFITASGQKVRDGIIANNFLPFGAKVRIPALFGDKIFEVQDRMHSRKGLNQVDIWFSSTAEAKSFGVKRTYIEIVE